MPSRLAARGLHAGLPAGTGAPSGRVVGFAAPPAVARLLSVRDRVAVLAWQDIASAAGLTLVRVEAYDPADGPEAADFVLVYRDGQNWATWGVAPNEKGYEVWRGSNGRSIGCFASMSDALGALLAAEKTEPRRG